MESPGEYLRRERELRGVSLKDLSEQMKVSLKLLEALEMDDYAPLPHPTYVKGFIRAYCNSLGLDGNDAVLRYEIYLKEVLEKAKEGKGAGSGEEYRLSSDALVVVFLTLGILTVILYFVFLRGPVSELGEPEEVAQVLPAERTAEDVTPAVPAAKPVPEAIEETHTLKINAKEVTWIRVVIDDGEPFEVLLKDGESISWEAARVFFC